MFLDQHGARPHGEAATGGSHVEGGDDRVGALLLTHGVSQDSARVRIAHGAQVDPTLHATQVGKVRDPHAVNGTLVPTAASSGPHGPLEAARRACSDAGTHFNPVRP